MSKLSSSQIETVVNEFREMLVKSDGGIRMSLFRPPAKDLTAPEDGWEHFIPGNTTYYFMVKGQPTPLERHILSLLHEKAKNSEDRCATCRHWASVEGTVKDLGECRRLIDSSGLMHGSRAIAVDDEGRFAKLRTFSNFGCTQWEKA